MKRKAASWMVFIFVLATMLSACGVKPEPAKTEKPKVDEAAAKEKEALETGIEAYVYGYPLVTMELTRRVMTNVPKPEGKLAPMGQFAKLRTYPSPADREVTAPNADTLYTLAWLDVSKEPWISEPSGHEGPLFPYAHALRMDGRLPGTWKAYHRDQGPEVRCSPNSSRIPAPSRPPLAEAIASQRWSPTTWSVKTKRASPVGSAEANSHPPATLNRNR